MIFSNNIYKKRREKLLSHMTPSSAALITSAPQCLYTGDVHYPYRPHSDMIYFTGWEEQNSCLLLLVEPDSTQKQILFVQQKDSKKELWTGYIHGPDMAAQLTEVNSTYPESQFGTISPELLKKIRKIYYTFGSNIHWDRRVKDVICKLKETHYIAPSISDFLLLSSVLRSQKSPEEVEKIKKAVAISSSAHIEVMKHTLPGKNERELEGVFLAKIMKEGAQREAYPSIFASGANSCTLHYTDNNNILEKGSLLLVDAGAEFHYYSSDISRTIPVKGRFTKTQKRLYNKLLQVQKNIIELLKPGLSFQYIQDQTIRLMTELLIKEKLLTGSLEKLIKQKKYLKYFPHNFGHSMGLDVHDVVHSPNSSDALKIDEGFVLTIEPGIYLPPNDLSLSEDMKGIGIRIEDDILITKTGHQVLSDQAPKEVEEIESLIGSHTH